MNTFTFLLLVNDESYAFIFIKTDYKINTIKKIVRRAFKKALNDKEEKFIEIFENTIKYNKKILDFNIDYNILHFINVNEKIK